MTALVRYDAACAALAAAVTADEVMAVHISAKAIEAVARVAKNIDLEIDAVKLRTRAEARLGQMLAEAEQSGLIRPGRPRKDENPSPAEGFSRAKLHEIGIDYKLSSRAQKLNGIGQRALETVFARFEEESRRRRRPALDVINEATANRSAESRSQLARDLSEATALLSAGRKFPIVYADPAWRRKAGIGNRAYENHYTTETWDEIIAMPVAKRVLPDAWLFLWIPRAHLLALHPTEIDTPLGRCNVKLPLAYAVAQAWGFDAYSTCFIWTKTDEGCPDDHGTCLIAWDQDEILCLFKRGRGLPKPDTDVKFGSNHRERAGAHSAKPTYYRDMINAMSGNLPVLELFACEDDEHPLPLNFFTWGNQSKNTAELPLHDTETGEIIETASSLLNSIPPTPVALNSKKSGPALTSPKESMKKSSQRGSRLSPGWKPTTSDIAFAVERGLPPTRIATEEEKFRNFWLAKGGADACKRDWAACWRNWIINAMERGYGPSNYRSSVKEAPSAKTTGRNSSDWRTRRDDQHAARDKLRAFVEVNADPPKGESGSGSAPSFRLVHDARRG